MLLWFILTALAVGFVAVDIRTTPEDPVMKWGFVIVTLFTGPLGAFLYVLGCREPIPGTHELYVQALWRQVLGSTMHCVAGDGVGIVVAAVVTSHWGLPMWLDVMVEYATGFTFGWTVFQALFMRGMAGGSYRTALQHTFMPELLSMNGVMTGMMVVMGVTMAHAPAAHNPAHPLFWFVMAMALIAGLMVAYPINWWLVAAGLKHGMMTVRHPEGQPPVPPIAGLFLAGRALGSDMSIRTRGVQRHETQHLELGSVHAPSHGAHASGGSAVFARQSPAPARPLAGPMAHDPRGTPQGVSPRGRSLLAIGSLTFILLGLGVSVTGYFGNWLMR